MKKFRFRLQALERFREQTEREARSKLSKAIARLRATQQEMLDIDRKEVEARERFEALGSGAEGENPKAQTFWMLDQFIKGQKARRKELQFVLEDHEIQVRATYMDFLKARQEKKAMEKLREKQEDIYAEALAKNEQKENDELYTTRHRMESLLRWEGEQYEE